MGRGNDPSSGKGVGAPLPKPSGASDLSGVAVSHARQQEMAAIVKGARDRVATGLGLRDSLPPAPALELLGSQEDDIESDSISQTLGDRDTNECSPGVRANVPSKQLDSSSFVPESEASGDVSPRPKQAPPGQKASFASLFASNRQASNGCKLDQLDVGVGPVQFSESDVDDVLDEWNFCLVGYFGGRFPGREALQKIISSWKVKVSKHFHASGWIIFKFEDEAAQLQVLREGPYMIYGRPLLLKIMDKFFNFENEDLSKFPVWVQFRNLPLALWTQQALSKLCSKLGKPIFADKFTSCRERVSFARALVEVDVSKEVLYCLELVLPNGVHMEQSVFYENLPKFCSYCKKVGHSLEGCQVVERAKNKAQNPDLAKGNGQQLKIGQDKHGAATEIGKTGGQPSITVMAKGRDGLPKSQHIRWADSDEGFSGTNPFQALESDAEQLKIGASELGCEAELLANVDQPIQPIAAQVHDRGKNKVVETQDGSLAMAETVLGAINDLDIGAELLGNNAEFSGTTVNKKKKNRKNKNKEGKPNLSAFCADLGGDSPNLCH